MGEESSWFGSPPGNAQAGAISHQFVTLICSHQREGRAEKKTQVLILRVAELPQRPDGQPEFSELGQEGNQRQERGVHLDQPETHKPLGGNLVSQQTNRTSSRDLQRAA